MFCVKGAGAAEKQCRHVLHIRQSIGEPNASLCSEGGLRQRSLGRAPGHLWQCCQIEGCNL